MTKLLHSLGCHTKHHCDSVAALIGLPLTASPRLSCCTHRIATQSMTVTCAVGCRKALHLLRHVVHAHPPDAEVACQLGAVQQAASHLASSDDDTWQAALALVQQLAQDTHSAQTLRKVCHINPKQPKVTWVMHFVTSICLFTLASGSCDLLLPGMRCSKS